MGSAHALGGEPPHVGGEISQADGTTGKHGGSLITVVTPGGEVQFNFKMLGSPNEDPGLDFRR